MMVPSADQSPSSVPSGVAYFNNAGKTWSPPSVINAGIQAIQDEGEPWKVPLESLDQITTDVRQLFASLIHAPNKDCIAICPSTAFAITLIAHNIARTTASMNTCDDDDDDDDDDDTKNNNNKKKKKVLVLQDEMSSEIYPWQEVFPCSLEIIPYPCSKSSSSSSWDQEIVHTMQNLKNQIVAVCIPQIHWTDGSIIGIEIISRKCQEYSIPLILDGTQSVGIFPMDVQDNHFCDALVVSTHKWLLGPRGTCLMYVHPKYHSTWLPLDQHERSRIAFQDDGNNAIIIDAMENSMTCSCGYPKEFISGAIRFDSGGKKNRILLSMVRQGLYFVLKLNIQQCQEQLLQMTTYIYQQVQDLGFYIRDSNNNNNNNRAGHILGLRPKNTCLWTMDKLLHLEKQLKDRNIYVAIRHGAIRISPYINTSTEEVELFIHGFKQVVYENE